MKSLWKEIRGQKKADKDKDKDKGKGKEVKEVQGRSGGESSSKPIDAVRAGLESFHIDTSAGGDGDTARRKTSGNNDFTGEGFGRTVWERTMQKPQMVEQTESFEQRNARKLLEEARDVYTGKKGSDKVTSLDHLTPSFQETKAIQSEYEKQVGEIKYRLRKLQSSDKKTREKSIYVYLGEIGYQEHRDRNNIIKDRAKTAEIVYNPLSDKINGLSIELTKNMGYRMANVRIELSDLAGIQEALSEVVSENIQGTSIENLRAFANDHINRVIREMQSSINFFVRHEQEYPQPSPGRNRLDDLEPA